ncbi:MULTISPECIES: hypothetical protein [Streptomyces]|uniref:hypothetical protein n=1 Tax=Streptomyces TaxID=1883 RepID=UPI00332A504A
MAADETNLLTTLIPAGALVLGYFMTMAGQAFADFRAGRRDLGARIDQLTIDIYKEDRAVLQQYHQVVCDLMLAYTEVQNRCASENLSPPQAHMTLEEKAHIHRLNAEQVRLYCQLNTDAVQNSGDDFGEAIGRWLSSSTMQESTDSIEALVLASGKIGKQIGIELKKTPYHQLGRRKSWRRRKRMLNRSLD